MPNMLICSVLEMVQFYLSVFNQQVKFVDILG